MLIKVSELQGNALDWAVAKCEDSNCYPSNWAQARLAYSTDWQLGGPIIEREAKDIWIGLNVQLQCMIL
jgi:hypothetical protein